MKLYNGLRAFLFLFLTHVVVCLPYRTLYSRSVPGRIRASSSDPESIKDYLSNYLEMAKQHQMEGQKIPYRMPVYEPIYQQGYLSRRPEISPDTVAALLPYLYQTSTDDYSYDDYKMHVPSSTSYVDEDGGDGGVWYDDATDGARMEGGFEPGMESRDKTNQDAALLQLFLDHLAGRYSLEDLETLERQAAIEVNTENQLRALMPRKKSQPMPPSELRRASPEAVRLMNHRRREGQKEEPLTVPASAGRKMFVARSSSKPQISKSRADIPTPSTTSVKSSSDRYEEDLKKASKMSSSFSSSSSSPTTTTSSSSSSSADPASTPVLPNASSQISPTTMDPSIKSAYEAFMAYLDQERFLRKTADEAEHSPQKRFVSEPQSLTQQLSNLKKTIT